MTAFTAPNTGELTELNDREERVRKREAALKEQEDLMEENRRKAMNRITLNLRGRLFTTSKQTLLRFSNSFFSAMLAHDRWQPDADGAYFIDRNPEYFDRILDYLADGDDLDVRGLDEYAQNKLRKECEFYLLFSGEKDKLQKDLSGDDDEPGLRWDKKFCGLGLNRSKKTVKKAGLTGWNAAALGTHSVSQFSIRALGFVMVGFAPRTNFNPNGWNCGSGYYLHLRTGALKSVQGNVKGYAQACTDGDVVTARYNADTKEISFARNDVDLGVAFRGVPEGLFPSVECYDTGAVVSFV